MADHGDAPVLVRQGIRPWVPVLVMVVLGLQAVVLRLLMLVAHVEPPAPLMALLFGIGILGAAFLLAWAAEVAEMDISASLALAFVALIAVLPEYAVDMYFAWQAGQHPEPFLDPLTGRLVDYGSYAVANMTGANRLLVGFGWPLIALLFFLHRRHARHAAPHEQPVRTVTPLPGEPPVLAWGRFALRLETTLSLEVVFLFLATAYAFIIPLMGEIAWWDAIIFIGLFATYIWLSSRTGKHEPELVGPAATIGGLPKVARRVLVVVMFVFAATVIIGGAEPFAEGLVSTGQQFGIDEFLLVQWLAPLASESPEILIAVILTLRGNAAAAMTALISSKVNQWTLLVGTLPVVYSISSGALQGLPMDAVQREEVFLTAAQSLFAVAVLLRMRIGWVAALALLLLFVGQLASPLYTATPEASTTVRYYFAVAYIVLAVGLVVADRARLTALGQMGRDVLRLGLGYPLPHR